MKILFTVESYYPKMSGVPVVTKYLAEGLLKKGHDIHIATQWVDGRDETEAYNGIEIHRFHVKHNLLKKPFGELEKYRKFAFESGFDAIVCECAQCASTDVLLPYLSKFKGKKILHSHGFSGMLLKPFQMKSSIRNTLANTVNYFNWNRYYDFWLKKYVNMFDEIFCLSEVDSSKAYLEKYAPGKVQILSNAADDVFFESQQNKDVLTQYIPEIHSAYFISVANYREYKNQIDILKEFYQIQNNQYAMVFIGSIQTDYYKKLMDVKKELDSKFGEKEVYCLAGVKRSDIPSIIGGATLYLVGSKFEEFSISLIECMALGIPFVSTDVGNARILPGGKTIGDISEMHTTVMKIIEDPDLVSRYSQAGRVYTRDKCRISKAVETLENSIMRS